MTPQTITLETEDGPAEASKAGPDAPWEILYPWGGDRLYGTKAEALALMRRRIRREQGETADA